MPSLARGPQHISGAKVIYIHPYLIGWEFPFDETQNLLPLLRHGRRFPQCDLEIEYPAYETISTSALLPVVHGVK